ncbi:MAG: hypothetical protein ABL864_14290 [Terricaulis sp.]
MNLYAYVANRPTSAIDPTGLCETTTGSRICGGGGAGVGPIYATYYSGSAPQSAYARAHQQRQICGADCAGPNEEDEIVVTARLWRTQLSPDELQFLDTHSLMFMRHRVLHPDEAVAALLEFPDIDTSVIVIYFDSPFSDTAVTLQNGIHFPSQDSGCANFMICGGTNYVGWFIHEVTHIWQYQHGVDPVAGAFSPYGYMGFEEYLRTGSQNLNTEGEADWHRWNYLCTQTTWRAGRC